MDTYRKAGLMIILAVCLSMLGSVCESAEKPAVIIDANKTGEPISKYIYGQFIEHLGRCIYGGIITANILVIFSSFPF